MVWPLFWRELRSCALPVLVFACVLALYAGVVVGMYDPGLGASLELMRDAMPELFAAFGMADQGSTLLEFLVNYLYGFLLVTFPLALLAMLADRLMVRHIERGSIAYLLAQPVGRVRLALSQLLVLLICLVALMAVLVAVELVAAEALFPGELAAADLLAVNASTLCLWALFAGVCWASACALPRTAAARWAGVALCVAFVLVKMAADVSAGAGAGAGAGMGTGVGADVGTSVAMGAGVGADAGLSWLAELTPLSLFDPLGAAAGDASAIAGSAVLAVAGLALAAFGVARFSRRDLSV